MAEQTASDYRLTPLPRRFRRREAWASAFGGVAFIATLMMAGVLIDGLSAEGRFLAGFCGWVVTTMTVQGFLVVTASPGDRELLASSRRRHLGPLAPDTDVDSRIALRPGPLTRRKITFEEQAEIVLDESSISVPVWAIVSPPRTLRRSDQRIVRVEWDDIEGWWVQSDPDGTDRYIIVTSRPWFDANGMSWPDLEIKRSTITDEIALLDAVRSVGQISIHLETSLVR